uniref:Cholecystokinin A receptor n=1 Tax=Petromyzon marinus TaxID=7757 RepID=S4RJ20_PETMA
DGDGCYVSPSRSAIEMGNLQQQQQTSLAHRNPSLEANLLAKKRVIRMLITIVVMFFICWTPVFSANAWRAFDKCRASQVLSGAPISFIHLMSYASACLNPIIYCFMNKRFRQACTATISRCCASVCCSPKGAAKGARCTHGGTPSGASMSRYTYTTVSTVG